MVAGSAPGGGVFENIIALNLDFRDNCKGQPFLFNPAQGGTWKGVALVNYRVDAAQQQSFAGDGDHILLWYDTILQGTLDETGGGFAILFTGDDDELGPTSYANLSIRNLVCERVRIMADVEIEEDRVVGGDVPSFFAALDNCHIEKELRDNTLLPVTITLFPQCTTGGGALQPLFADYPLGQWSPNLQGPLVNRVGDEDIVYRYDALGANRTTTIGDGAVGAVDQ